MLPPRRVGGDVQLGGLGEGECALLVHNGLGTVDFGDAVCGSPAPKSSWRLARAASMASASERSGCRPRVMSRRCVPTTTRSVQSRADAGGGRIRRCRPGIVPTVWRPGALSRATCAVVRISAARATAAPPLRPHAHTLPTCSDSARNRRSREEMRSTPHIAHMPPSHLNRHCVYRGSTPTGRPSTRCPISGYGDSRPRTIIPRITYENHAVMGHPGTCWDVLLVERVGFEPTLR